MRIDESSKRIAVVGCGYVGSALGEALVQAGHDVVGTTTTPERCRELEKLRIKPAVINVADVGRLHDVLADRDAVYLTIAPRQRGADYEETYLRGVKRFLRAAEGTPLRRIIYTSSTRVYGQDDGSWVDESSPAQPQDRNGRLLLEAEQTLLEGVARLGTEAVKNNAARSDAEHRRGLKPEASQDGEDPCGLKPAAGDNERKVYTTIVRLGGIYGPGRDLYRRVLNCSGTQRGDGDAYINLIHLDDIVTALMALLDVRHHGVLNLTDDQPERRRECYDRILAEAGLPPIRWVPSAFPPRLGKRVRNELIKRIVNITLKRPTH